RARAGRGPGRPGGRGAAGRGAHRGLRAGPVALGRAAAAGRAGQGAGRRPARARAARPDHRRRLGHRGRDRHRAARGAPRPHDDRGDQQPGPARRRRPGGTGRRRPGRRGGRARPAAARARPLPRGGARMSARALLPVATPARTLQVLRELLRPRRTRAAVAFAALVGGAAAGLLTAPLLGLIIDLVASGAGPDAVTWPAVGLVAVAVAQGLLAALGVAQTAQVGEEMLAQLRERLVDRALGLPLERIEAAGAGDLGSRVTEDVAQIGEAVREGVPALARYGLVIVLTFVGLAVLDWRFLPAAATAVPIQVLTTRWYLRRATPLYAEQRIAAGAQQQQLLDTTTGLATVRAFRLTDRHTEQVRDRSQRVVDLALRVVGLQNGFFGRLNLAELVGLSAVLTTGFLLVGSGAVSIGTASAAAIYFIGLFNPVNAVLFLLQAVQAAAASLPRIVGVA